MFCLLIVVNLPLRWQEIVPYKTKASQLKQEVKLLEHYLHILVNVSSTYFKDSKVFLYSSEFWL